MYNLHPHLLLAHLGEKSVYYIIFEALQYVFANMEAIILVIGGNVIHLLSVMKVIGILRVNWIVFMFCV